MREERLEEYNARIQSKIIQTGDSNDKKINYKLHVEQT